MELPKSDHELKALCASCLAPECLGRDKHKMNASVCGWHQPVTLAHIAPLESMRSRLCAALGLPADSAPETVAEAVEARRVVVPEPTCDEWRVIAENARSADMVDFLAGAAAYGLWFREHSRAIPADRVLGDGMVAVNREELRALERVRMEAEYVKDAFQQMGEFSQMESIMRALHELDALRANQGGADHGND